MGVAQEHNKDGDDIARPEVQNITTDPEKRSKHADSDEHESHLEQDESDVETLSHHEEESGEIGDDDDENPRGLNNTNATVDSGPAASRTQSRASSTRSRALTIVPISKRRGLFARFCVVPEVERPYDYSNKTKWTITLVVALAAAGGPLGSNLLYRKYSPYFGLAAWLCKARKCHP